MRPSSCFPARMNHHVDRQIPYTTQALKQDLLRLRNAWHDYQASRDRNAVYGYLSAVFNLVAWWTAENRDVERARQALRLQNISPSGHDEPFAAVIRCTADPAKVDKRTRSKWSRVLRYALEHKSPAEPLDQFIKRKGGINRCASRFARCLGRRGADRCKKKPAGRGRIREPDSRSCKMSARLRYEAYQLLESKMKSGKSIKTKSKKTKATPQSPRTIEVTETYLRALRKTVGRQIDPETAEVDWRYRQVLDPYGDGFDIPEEEQVVGREYFARVPNTDVWILFSDLPSATRKRLWEKQKSKLAFPAGLEDFFQTLSPKGSKKAA
jgi:hypothetical protein